MNIYDESLKAAIRELARRYPRKSRSWIRRSLRRYLSNGVMRIGENTWLVKGDPKMSDSLPQYIVRFVNGKYTCDCQVSMWGESRKLCTHIGAVILSQIHEEMMKTVYVATITLNCKDNQLLILSKTNVEVHKRGTEKGTTYIIKTNNQALIKALVACNDEIKEIEIETKPSPYYKLHTS